MGQALILLPAYLASGLALSWASRRGFGVPLLLFGLALALRSIQIETSPPGWRIDEVVSLVDAWNLAHTGHDHLGHLLPISAFEALGDWISPLLTYLELPFVALVGPQPLVGRLVTASIGALAAPLGYALARTLGFNRSGMIATGLAMALSPWQISMSRSALPPSLVPTCWILCMLVGLRFIMHQDRRSALSVAVVAGVALYAYPTMKMAVPLLVALTLGLALAQNWRSSVHHPGSPRLSLAALLPAGIVLAILWVPFASMTLFNPASATRLNQAALHADSWQDWLKAWWAGYVVYTQPDFYFQVGDRSPNTSVPGFGLELWATLPLVLLGMAGLIGSIAYQLRLAQQATTEQTSAGTTLTRIQLISASFILGALLISALPASVTTPSPHAYRAAQIAPIYALLGGYGMALLLPSGFQRRSTGHYWLRQLTTMALAVGLLWQGTLWWQAYTEAYPLIQAGSNQDGLNETMRRVIDVARSYDEIWISYDSIDEPYIYVLAAQPFPPDQSQHLIIVKRRPNRFNDITSIGPYRFVDTSKIPIDLPTLIAVPANTGGTGYIAQELTDAGRRILVVRQM